VNGPDPRELDGLSIMDIRSLDPESTDRITRRLIRRAQATTSSMGGHDGGGGFDYSSTEAQSNPMPDSRPATELRSPSERVEREPKAQDGEAVSDGAPPKEGSPG
jgi:hypothetical protein